MTWQIDQDTLICPRVDKLKLIRIYERTYPDSTIGRSNTVEFVKASKRTFQYELCFQMILSRTIDQINDSTDNEYGDPNISTMTSQSIFELGGCQLLGLISDSLVVVDGQNNPKTMEIASQPKPCHITIKSNLLLNSISITYFIKHTHRNHILRFRLITRAPLDINLSGTKNIEKRVQPRCDSLQYHRNGIAKDLNSCHVLHVGFHLSSIKNEHSPIQLRPLDEIRMDLQSADFTELIYGRSRRNRKRKSSVLNDQTSYISSIISQTTSSLNFQICIFIEHINHPMMIMKINSEQKIISVKKKIQNILRKSRYYVPDVFRIRLIFNTKILKDDVMLNHAFGDLQTVRCAMVLNEPFVTRNLNPPESQKSSMEMKTIQKLKSCQILLRNVDACNKAAENFLQPRARQRFSEPTIAFTGTVFSKDLGQLILTIADQSRRLSLNLSRLGHRLVKDQTLTPHSHEYERYKRLIQNVMDATRYMGPLFKSLSKFVIPLASNSPRPISVRED